MKKRRSEGDRKRDIETQERLVLSLNAAPPHRLLLLYFFYARAMWTRSAQRGIKCPRAQFCANGTKGCKQEGLAWMGLLAARQAWPGMEPYRAHSRAGWLLYRAGAPYYLGPIGASLPVQLILWHLRLRPALPLPRQPAVKCIKSNRVRPIQALVYWCVYYISIPRRNCSTLEKGQLQVRRDLCQPGSSCGPQM